MRRLRGRSEAGIKQDHERGAAAVVVAFTMVALLGFAALAVDVGAMYAEKAQLQNGADATALAIAGDCAKGVNCGTAMADADNRLADANANDESSGTFSVTQPSANSVRVETNAQEAGSTADSFTLFFARAFGNDTAVIHASAVASWGTPSSAETLPWTVSKCVFEKYLSPSQLADLNATGNFTGDPIPTHILLRYDENTPTYPGCAAQNGYAPGGFGWLDTDTGCSAEIDVANSEVGSNPGNDLPNVCQDMPATIKDEPVLIPIFTTAAKNGAKTKYSLAGFIAFQVTGFKFGGGPSVTSLDPAAPSCTGSCRGIQGYFTRFVSLEEGLSLTGGLPNYGATVVALTE
ncbi:pilus assembly protein TadG-related protein [Pseudarthrobacter sp. R1]|uniref:TadE/TadG family type IV pilus assembly protein n=1 Tax=Pseudarthrobacter sp. R1 TaxID=2944934 RepID=UPI002108D59A|nr:TadE/TadG family type IV pilus assembly protein [Pseudarthrobacter sp. R1]MCQ6271396.1 pilus assembly protein TadG-related protein [Pseudarthrobacter sp. R1]